MLVLLAAPAEFGRRGDSGVVWIGVLLWIASCFAASWWSKIATRDYERLYRARVTPRLPTEETPAEHYILDPGRWFVEGPVLLWRLIHLYWTPQADPELEAARRRMLGRHLLVPVVMVLGLAFPLILQRIA